MAFQASRGCLGQTTRLLNRAFAITMYQVSTSMRVGYSSPFVALYMIVPLDTIKHYSIHVLPWIDRIHSPEDPTSDIRPARR
jgi:hypothetical protein